MKKTLIILLFIICPVLLYAYSLGNYIDNYEINIEVDRDNTYTITENIRYYFSDPSHGIYRIIKTKGPNGQKIKVSDFKASTPIVRKDFYPDHIKYTIGDPDTAVRGYHDFSISYKYDVGRDLYEEYDYFYYNLLGNEWDDKIKNLNFNIFFDSDTKLDKEAIKFLRGNSYGLNSGGVWTNVNDNEIFGNAIDFESNESCTILVELEDGYFSKADAKFQKNIIKSKLFIMLPMLCFVLLLIFTICTITIRPNQKLIPVFPGFSGFLDDFSPFEVGYLYKGKTDFRAVSGQLMSFADRGYISIKYTKKKSKTSKDDVEIHRLKNADDKLTPVEKIFFRALFKNRDIVNVNDNNSNIPIAIKAVESKLKAEHNTDGKRLFTKQSVIISTIIIILTLIIVAISVATWIFVINTLGIGNIMYIILYLALSVAGTVIFPTALIILSKRSKRRTEYYSSMLEKIMGVKDYIETVEKDKIKELYEIEPGVFYKILSFALPLECEDKLANMFKGMTIPENTNIFCDNNVMDLLFYLQLTRVLNESIMLHSSLKASQFGGGGHLGPSTGGMGGWTPGGGFGGGGGGRW